MVTVQCMRKNLTGCTKKAGLIYMRDRTKRVFPVKQDCVFCYNTVYNSEVLSLKSELQYLMTAGYTDMRISLTTETYGESEEVLRAFGSADSSSPSGSRTATYTKGHFNRGVE